MGDAVSSESYTPRQRTTYRRRLEDELERFDRHLQAAEFVDHGTIGLELERGLYTANALANERLILDTVAAAEQPVRHVVLGLRQQEVMSITVLDALENLDRELSQLGVTLHLAALPTAASEVAARIATRTGAEWQERFAAADCCCSLVGNLATAMGAAHLPAEPTLPLPIHPGLMGP